jgi:hypothetical protein
LEKVDEECSFTRTVMKNQSSGILIMCSYNHNSQAGGYGVNGYKQTRQFEPETFKLSHAWRSIGLFAFNCRKIISDANKRMLCSKVVVLICFLFVS